MYFEDLTPYNYEPRYRDPDDENTLNVGWLDGRQPFQTGPTSQHVQQRLIQLSDNPVRIMRGYHFCEVCKSDVSDMKAMFALHSKGNGEIRVTSKSGITYAAPVMICHYIAAHHYLPPQEFLDAVMES